MYLAIKHGFPSRNGVEPKQAKDRNWPEELEILLLLRSQVGNGDEAVIRTLFGMGDIVSAIYHSDEIALHRAAARCQVSMIIFCSIMEPNLRTMARRFGSTFHRFCKKVCYTTSGKYTRDGI